MAKNNECRFIAILRPFFLAVAWVAVLIILVSIYDVLSISTRIPTRTELLSPKTNHPNPFRTLRNEPLFLYYVRFKSDDTANVTLQFLDYSSVLSAVQS